MGSGIGELICKHKGRGLGERKMGGWDEGNKNEKGREEAGRETDEKLANTLNVGLAATHTTKEGTCE